MRIRRIYIWTDYQYVEDHNFSRGCFDFELGDCSFQERKAESVIGCCSQCEG